MGILFWFSIVFIVALVVVYLVNSCHEYFRGQTDGKNEFLMASTVFWYRLGYKAGASEASKPKLFIGKTFESIPGCDDKASIAVKPDSNGKIYRYFHLITSGELKGMYRPFYTFGQCSYTNEIMEREMSDIINSGLQVYIVDPKGS